MNIFFSFKTHNEAENFIKYLKTDICRFALSIYKNNSQLDRGELKSIPWLDFSETIEEKELIKKINITDSEIEFIKSKISKYYI